MDNLFNFGFSFPYLVFASDDFGEAPSSEIPSEFSSEEFSSEGLSSSEEVSSEASSQQSYQEVQEENVNLGKIEQNTRALTGLFMVFLVGVGLFLVVRFFFGLFNK